VSPGLRALVACALLAPAARPLTAATRPEDLASIAAALEQRDREQRAEFEAAAARPLPPKARQRLGEAKRAWEQGQGRVLTLLRAQRVADARPGAAGSSAPELEEALALLERIRAASRPEPLSEGELKTRVPELRPPALAVSPATSVTAGDEPPIGTIAPEVRERAASFSGPIEAYEWVRNAIRPEIYHGVMKGPAQTLLEGSGNDADTAGLLIALLRAKGIPARYVRGTVDLPAPLAVAVTGTTSAERALRAFGRAGVPSEPVGGPGGLAALRVERVWVEAYVPYANYRGAVLDAHEKAWVPLDPGLKRLAPPGGYDVRSAGFDPGKAFDDLLRAAPGPTPLELYRQRAAAALADRRPDVSYEEALARRDVIEQSLGLLPSTLPYAVVARAEVGYAPPAPLVHAARFVVEGGGTTLLDASFEMPALLGQRLTLSWVPFEADDEEVVRQYGGLFLTPPYLVEVMPVLNLGGVALANGTDGAGLGVKLDFRIELSLPGGAGRVENRVIAGNLTAIGLAAGRVTAEVNRQDEAARVLARLAFRYLDRWNRSDEELAALLRVVPVRPSVSTCLVQSAVAVEYAGGDPLYPVRYEWKGLAIDADRRPSAPVGIETDAAERDFLLASGLEGSALEHRLFEDDLAIPSVSTAKVLQLAAQSGIEVLDLGPDDAESVLAGLALDEAVEDEIRAAAAKGYRIRVPSAPLAVQAWTGLGYLILDPATGESAWQLQGGHSGGVTVPAVIDIPAELVDVVWRQSETPSPTSRGVAILQKFDTTDFQLGTVDEPLAKPLKVLATDEDGFPVPGAPVTFSVIGGGGRLVDPATGRSSASEITVLSCAGGETMAPCASLKPGEAVATLRLGRTTGEIPLYTCEEPFTCTCPPGEDGCDRDTVGHTTQVGLNLVAARSGDVELPEPFTAVAFPEKKPVEGVPGAIQVFVGLAAPPVYNPVNLTVADRMALSVTDRHGNPLSNVLMRVAYEGPPELGPPPPGGSLFRGVTQTPGHVLRAQDYGRCLETTPSVLWGQCPGEAESVETRSSSVGVSVFPVVGDSPWSYYKFNYGTTLDPSIAWIKYHTNGMSCRHPDPSSCLAWDAPITFVWQGTRPVMANLQGNVVEAYPPGGVAEVGLWADVLWEEADVTRTVDAQGRERFRAKGTNVWRRDRLTDSEIALRPLSAGTSVAATAGHVGEGRYAAGMTLASEPRRNTVEVAGRHFPPVVKYLGATGGDVDPVTIDRATLALSRVKDPARPVQIVDSFSLWGVEPRVTGVEPSPVFLSAAGLVTRESSVTHEIAPPEYGSLLAPNDVRFEVRAVADDRLVLVANGAEAPAFRIPAGLSLASGQHYARLSLRAVSGGGTDLSSAEFPVPICPVVDLLTPVVRIDVTNDPVNRSTCGAPGKLEFHLCRDTRITLTVADTVLTASLDGNDPMPLADVTLAAGPHVVFVPAGLAQIVGDAVAPFSLSARDLEDPGQVAVADGVITLNVRNRSVLPVGRTFVKGVDLYDGHLVQQSTDVKVPGRHLGLEVTRTYSSTGSSSAGPLGGGWSFNYGSGVFPDGDCGLVTVVTADGSSQVFSSGDGLQSFEPQKGYHARLERTGSLDHSVYRFTDKAGNVHHFESQDASRRPRLDFIEEPHGDRLVFTYDGADRLTEVAEVHPEAGEVRAVTFTYRSIYGEDRIVRAEIAALGLAVDYEYDAQGNLTKATRDGANLSGAAPAAAPRVERYRYLALPPGIDGRPPLSDFRKQHQLVETTDPNGNRREYGYYGDSDPLPGEEAGGGSLIFQEKWERVRQVVEHPAPALSIRTELSYDLREALTRGEWKTTVRDGRGNDTVYVLNGNGSPLEIREPLGKTTRMTWAADDILKLSETDANGRVTEFGYDDRGNLASERVLTPDLGPILTEYAYHGRFNKLTRKKDAAERITTHAVDDDSGDLLATVDAVGNRTAYAWDEHGRLRAVTDPRGYVTAHRSHDSFGNAREVEDPLGNVTTRTFDGRGRLTAQSDTMGRETRQEWDGLDRLVRVTRVAGGESDDDVTQTAYYPGGEVRLVRNANGAETTSTIDGLGRVIGTETRLDGQVLTTATTWDANGNKETETDRRGVTRRFVHDALNRLKTVEIVSGLPGEGPTGTIAGYGYDLVGNKTSETSLAGLVTRFELDGLYRVKAKVLPEVMPDGFEPPGPLTERYAYDKVGNRTSFTDPNGRETNWAYDGLNRVTRATNALGQATTLVYKDPEPNAFVNKSEEFDWTRGLRTTFIHDPLNRETSRTVGLEGAGGGGASYTTATAYDDRNHALSVTDPRGHVTTSRLDGLDRVVEQTVDPGGLSLVTRTSYDGLGNRKSLTDANGHTTRLRHDGLGRLVETTDAADRKTAAAYDGEGLKISETDRRGIERVLAYDNLGRPRREALAAAPLTGKGWSQETRYRDRERQRVAIDARGHATTFDLDGLDRVVRETDALGHFRTFRWDGVNKREETDKRPAHHVTRFEYDALDRLKKVTDPAPFDGQTVETTYEDTLNQVTEKDRRGFVKRTDLDPLGRVVKVTRAVGTPDEAAVESNTWDGNGNKETAIDAEDRVTRFAYDAANRLGSRTDAFGTPDAATTTFAYDGVGNVLEEKDARAALLGGPWSAKRTYDALNRLETETDGEGNVTTYGYDPEGNRTSTTNPKLQTTTTTYDELGKPLDITQPPPKQGDPSPVTRFRYDENRNLVRMEDADGRVTKLDYDELNRLFRTTRDPGGLDLTTTTTDFDEDGHPLRILEANGEVTRQTWDELGRLATRTHEPPASGWTAPWAYTTEERYGYDANSNLERVRELDSRTGGSGPPERVTTRGYDRLDRQTSETVTLQDETTSSVTTEYFKDGRVKSVTDPRGVTSYTYDGQGREETVTTSGGVTRKTYYPDGLVKDITFPNGTKRAHGYDKADRLLTIVTTKDEATVASTVYTYDSNGNRLTQVQTNGGSEEATTYTYDDLDRLWTVTYPAAAEHPNGRMVTYGHDQAGNRKTEVVTDRQTEVVLESKTGIFDNVNRLTELTDNLEPAQTTTLLWDKNGNLLSETKAGVTTSYRYDLRDTLAEVERGGQALARFLGDFDERRVLKIGDPTRPGGSGVQEYLYYGSRLVLDVENGQPTARYEWTNEELVSLLQSGGTRRYFALDGLETVLALTDEAGQATDRLNFDAWGVPKEGTDFGTSGNRFAFTSHRFDTELDLYYAGGRMYSPTIGRFISQDTLSLEPNNPDTWNLFGYARANPTRYVDPTGHQTVDPYAPPDDVIGGEASLAAVKAGQARDNAASSNQPWNPEGPPTPTTITEEDGLGSSALSFLAGALAKVGEFNESVKTWIGDRVDAWTSKKLQPRGDRSKADALQQLADQETNNPALQGAARDLARTRDVAGGAQKTGTEIARKGAEGGAEFALEAIEAETGAKFAGMAVGALGGAAQKVVRSSRALGAEGETLVVRHLEAKGYTEITAIQNRSGHGIDILARNNAGELRFFEVKTTTTGEAGRLSSAQRYTENFITSRLERASQAQGQWQNLDAATRHKAADALAEIRGGASVRGVKIDVMYPAGGAEGAPQLQFSRWREK
jgi:RHS repeat-associated protein